MPKPTARVVQKLSLAGVVAALVVAAHAGPASAHGIENPWSTSGVTGVSASGTAHLTSLDSCQITGRVYDNVADGHAAGVTIESIDDNGHALLVNTITVTSGNGTSEPINVTETRNMESVYAREWTSEQGEIVDIGPVIKICTDDWYA